MNAEKLTYYFMSTNTDFGTRYLSSYPKLSKLAYDPYAGDHVLLDSQTLFM